MATLHNLKPKSVIRIFKLLGLKIPVYYFSEIGKLFVTTRIVKVDSLCVIDKFFVRGSIMKIFSEDQIKRQDFVDNEIYDLVKRLNPSKREIEWDIEMIGDVRDTIQHWLFDRYRPFDELEFYP